MFVILLVFIFWCSFSLVSPFLPLFAEQLQFTVFETSFYLSVVGIIRFCSQFFLGISIAKLNERRVLKSTFIVLFICNLGYYLVNNFYLLIALRVLEALAFACFVISGRVIINNSFNQDKILTLNNYYSGVQNFGNFIGSALAGFFIANFGLRSIFLAATILYLLGIIISVNYLNRSNIPNKVKNLVNSKEQLINIIKHPKIILCIVWNLLALVYGSPVGLFMLKMNLIGMKPQLDYLLLLLHFQVLLLFHY